MAAAVPARTDRWGCKLAAAALVLAAVWAPRSADAQSPKLEAAYVVLGSQGAVARAVLAQASSCPDITVDGAQQPMSVRALPDATFPVLVCERTIPAGATSNGQLISYRFLKTGRYLVICMNRVHFLNDWMFGFVNVVGGVQAPEPN